MSDKNTITKGQKKASALLLDAYITGSNDALDSVIDAFQAVPPNMVMSAQQVIDLVRDMKKVSEDQNQKLKEGSDQ